MLCETVHNKKSTVLSCPSDTSYVILDVETTGLNPHTDKIVQLSAIKYDCNGRPFESFNSYLNPGCHIPERTTKTHGITDEMVSFAPSAADIANEFAKFIEGNDVLVGYNTSFDLRFICAEFNGICSGRQYVDALQIARLFYHTPDYKLETVSRHIGFLPEGGFHDAFSDCEAVAALLNNTNIDLRDFCKEFCWNSHPCSKPERPYRHREPAIPYDEFLKIANKDPDPNHPLYGKNIVFTGELSISRADAGRLSESVGAIVKDHISKKTDFLVVGEQDLTLVGYDGMSTKEEKAYELNASGKVHIHIIGEKEFFDLLKGVAIFREDTPKQTGASVQEEKLFLSTFTDAMVDAIDARGGDGGKLIINPTTPPKGTGYTAVKLNNFTIFRLCFRGKQHYISVPTVFTDIIPGSYPRKKLKSEEKYWRILIDGDHPTSSYTDFLVRLAAETVDRYPKEWDCCSLYTECSDAKKCIHSDKAFALGCGYRKILNSGRIFYGQNRNID